MKLAARSSKKERAPANAKPSKSSRGKAGAADKKGGKGNFVLIIGDDGAILVFMRGNTVVRRLFAPSPQPDHTASIVELMQANPKAPVTILADVLDQQYVRHSFPPVSSLSVSGLVKRRLERDFQAEDLKGSLPLGRDKSGRKEWNYLLIALANTTLMQQWLNLVVELPNEMKGIYLVPVEGQFYIPALKKYTGGAVLPWQLLVTHNKVSGFRQVVLKDGKLVFTRVTQAIDDGVAAVVAGNIEQEIINTIEYLRRLGFQENTTLEITVITAQEVKETLDLNRFQVGAGHVLTPLEVSDALGLQQAALSADRFGDVVMAAWFARTKKRRLKFVTAYAQQLSTLYLARRGAVAVGTLAFFGLMAVAVMSVLAANTLSGEATAIDRQRQPVQSELATLKKAIDGMDKDIAFKTAVVSVHTVYLKDGHSPLDFTAELAAFVNTDFRVSSIDWALASAAAATAAAPGAPAVTGAVQAKVTVEMFGTYDDVETLTKAADAYVATLKAGLPRYDITAAPYRWLQNSNESGLEISFGQQAQGTASDTGARVIELVFSGPKPDAPTTAPVTP